MIGFHSDTEPLNHQPPPSQGQDSEQSQPASGLAMHGVSGRILLDGWQGEPGPATVYVRLLDTSRIDASARKVEEVVFHDVRLDRIQDDGLEFHLKVGELEPRARYEVGVLVDLDGDGKKGVGDYLNTQSYPVLTRGYPDQAEVRVRRIG